jgi:hypothetical protein
MVSKMKYKVNWTTINRGWEVDGEYENLFDQKDIDKAADLVFHLMLCHTVTNVEIRIIDPVNHKVQTEEEGA